MLVATAADGSVNPRIRDETWTVMLLDPSLDLPLIGVGAVTGALSGLLGVGGSFLVVPGLLWLGWDLPGAIGTSLLYVTVIGLAGALAHLRQQNLDLRFLCASAVPALAGAQLGARALAYLPVWLLDGAFALLLVYAAWELGVRRGGPEREAPASPRWQGASALGLVVGVLSGALGVGGGVLLVPGQTRWLDVPLVRAVGNSLAVVVLAGVSGVAAHLTLGNVSWHGGACLALGGLFGLVAGLRGLRALPVPVLRRCFMSFLALLAFYMAAKGFGVSPLAGQAAARQVGPNGNYKATVIHFPVN